MVNRKWWMTGISLLVVSGFLTFLTADRVGVPIERKPEVQQPKTSNQSTVQEAVNEEPEPPAPILNTGSNGWGFLKNKDHKTPEITAEQLALIKKYDVIFVANEAKPEVVLTFDLGYENGYTGRILDILKRRKVKAIFFVTGPWLKENQALARRMVTEGHIIGNHTWGHPSLPTLSKAQLADELTRLQDYIIKSTGQNRKYRYLRPPKGEYSEQSLMWTKELGYTTVLWSVALRDWLPMSGPQEAIDGVVNNLHNGAVILLHGVSKDVTEGLDQIIVQVREQGYKIVPITQIKA